MQTDSVLKKEFNSSLELNVFRIVSPVIKLILMLGSVGECLTLFLSILSQYSFL